MSAVGVIVSAVGGRFQIIADLDATAVDAPGLADRALDWLVREGIVGAERTSRVSGVPGYPPAGQWAKAVTGPGSKPEGGLSIQTGQTVFHSGAVQVQYATCPQCAGQTWFYTEDREPVEGASEAFDHAIRAWHSGQEASVTCPSCAQASELPRWRWADDFYAFGYLGFEFWEWPEFSPRFIADFSRVLDDHRVVRFWGRL